jgi:1-phosphofructokinase
MSDVTIFAPSPILTVTVEDHPAGDEVHVHAGGQGVWQARMLTNLGVSVTLCCALTGEMGPLLRHLIEDEGIGLAPVERPGRGSAYVHDRRGGERKVIADVEGDPLGRHELDELYGIVLREALASGLAILSGPAGEETLPADTYRRLAADIRAGGGQVVADLAGARLQAALAGGVDVLKVSDAELQKDGLLGDESEQSVFSALRRLRDAGARTVIVTRAARPLLLLDSDGLLEVTAPELEVTDTRGAGDSFTAGLCAALARGQSIRDAVVMGAAAGALNVTRHGLGTGDPESIAQLSQAVRVRSIEGESDDGSTGHVSPDELAGMAEPEPHE